MCLPLPQAGTEAEVPPSTNDSALQCPWVDSLQCGADRLEASVLYRYPCLDGGFSLPALPALDAKVYAPLSPGVRNSSNFEMETTPIL